MARTLTSSTLRTSRPWSPDFTSAPTCSLTLEPASSPNADNGKGSVVTQRAYWTRWCVRRARAVPLSPGLEYEGGRRAPVGGISQPAACNSQFRSPVRQNGSVQSDRIAAQFYTLREFTKTPDGFSNALKRIAEIGYTAVQLSAVGAFEQGTTATEARSWLDEYGLRCVATHRTWKRLTSEVGAEIEFHHTLGCDYAAIGGTVWDYGYEPADYRRFMLDARPVIAALKSAGIRFGVHNHAA